MDIRVDRKDKHYTHPPGSMSISSVAPDALCIAGPTFNMPDSSTFTFLVMLDGEYCVAVFLISGSTPPRVFQLSRIVLRSARRTKSENLGLLAEGASTCAVSTIGRASISWANNDWMCKSAPRWSIARGHMFCFQLQL